MSLTAGLPVKPYISKDVSMAKKIFGDTSAPNMSVVTIKRGGRTLARGLVTTAVAAALVTGMGGIASAGTSPGSTTGNVAVTSAIALTVGTTAFTLTGTPNSTQTDAAAVSYSVTTNNLAGYAVTVQAAAPTLAATATGNADFIPIAALTVKGDAAGAAYTPVSNTTATTVHTQTTRSLSTGDPHSDGYQIVIPFVNQDTYHVTLNYVATTL
jgi:hypothetical protein